ncbi:site-specific integrase [Botrimarina sp.]|uniref:tyrosine-type recombinase/integrase n=1 Tax=Botrimarina sp. TaxID=2795802 RepID=UPI0032EC716A
MPKLTNRTPNYRLHRASGQAVVTLSGRDFYLGPYGSDESRLAYDRRVAQWLANGRRLTPTRKVSGWPVERLLAEFWLHAQRYYVGPDGQPTSELDAYRQVMKPLRAMYGSTPVDAFGPLAFKALREALVARGLTRKSVNQRMGRVRRIFKWGVEQEYVRPGTYQALQAVSGLKQGRCAAIDRDRVASVPDEVVDATLPYLSSPVAAMVRLQRVTGMRPAEVIQMRPCDLDQSDPACWLYRPAHHKNAWRGRDRVVYLGADAQAILRPFLNRDAERCLFSPQEAVAEARAERARGKSSTLRRPTRRAPRKQPGLRYSTGSYGKAVASACRKAGVEHWSPNRLRHSFATEIRRRYGLEAAQVLLGHSKADVTQVYAERDHERARQIVIGQLP